MIYNPRIRELVSTDEPRLHKPSQKVELNEVLHDPLFQQLIGDMIVTMQAHNGVGLAAPQIGVFKRVAIIATKPVVSVIINPIVERIDELGEGEGMPEAINETNEEGCLSLPERTYTLTRATRIMVRCLTPTGRRVKHELTKYMARVVQHEVDHLNGILICDRATVRPARRSSHRKELHGYSSISPSRTRTK